MNDERTYERTLRDWLEAGPTQAPDQAVEAVLRTIASTTQERGRWAPWRTPRMSAFIRVAAIAAVAAAIISVPVLVNRSTQPAAVAPPPLPPTACPTGTTLKSGDIATVGGGGAAGPLVPGVPATTAFLTPRAVAVAPDGSLMLALSTSRHLWQIGRDGIITDAFDAGTTAGYSDPSGLAFDQAGDLFVATSTSDSAAVWKLDPSLALSRVAGNGTWGTTGNEGLAIDAMVNASGVAVGPSGDLYLDDLNNYRIIDSQGVIHAFAGGLTPGSSGDGGAAIAATFGQFVGGIAAAADGSVYLGDPSNHRIRKVDPAGVIHAFAGTGTAGYSGDRGSALAAELYDPVALAMDDAGNVYVADDATHTVRKIDPSGTITTVAGTGVAGFSGDCGPAATAQLDGPTAIAVANGVLYIVDGGNGRIRMVAP